MNRSKFYAFLMGCLILLAGCVSPQIRTVIVDDRTGQTDGGNAISVSAVHSVRNAIRGGSTVSFLGFSHDGQILGTQGFGNEKKIVQQNINTGAVSVLMRTGHSFTNAAVVDSGRKVIFGEQSGENTKVMSLDLLSGTVQEVAHYKTSEEMIGARCAVDGGVVSFALRKDGDYRLHLFDLNTGQSREVNFSSLVPQRFVQNLSEVALKDAYLFDEDRALAKLSVSGEDYLVLKEISEEGKVVVCSNVSGKVVSSGRYILYIDNQQTLYLLDADKNEEIEIAADVKSVSMAADGKIAVFLQQSRETYKIYALDLEELAYSLIDLRQNVREFFINAAGDKVLVRYWETSETGRWTTASAVLDLDLGEK